MAHGRALRTVAVALLAFGAIAGSAGAQDGDTPEDVLRAAQSVVLVHTELARGTGFVVEPVVDEIATSSEVMQEREEARITTLEGRAVEVEVAGRDPVAGLAILSIDEIRAEPIALAAESAEEGDTVYAVGPPVGYGVDRIRELEVTDVSGEKAERRITLDGPAPPEGLGGPLLTADGTVVGVVVENEDDRATGVPVGRVNRVVRVPPEDPPWTWIWVGALGAIVGVALLSGYATSRSRRRWERQRQVADDSAQAREAIEEQEPVADPGDDAESDAELWPDEEPERTR